MKPATTRKGRLGRPTRATRRTRRLPKPLKEKELNAVRAACTRSATGTRNRAMVEAMAGAGLRVSEVVALMPGDIDWQKGTIRVNEGKGGRDRVVPVTGETLDRLAAWAHHRKDLGLNGRQSFFVGIRTRGEQLSIRTAQGIIARLGEKAGLDRAISPHLLRHTYATKALSDGLTIREVQQLLGHSDVSTTMIYTHVDPDELRQKIQGDNAEKKKKGYYEVLVMGASGGASVMYLVGEYITDDRFEVEGLFNEAPEGLPVLGRPPRGGVD